VKTKLLDADRGGRTYAIVFDPGDEVFRGLEQFANAQGLRGAHFNAIGAFSQATLGYFDRQTKSYRKIPITEQVEVVSLIGNIADAGGKAKLHAHVVVGKSDGTAYAGHLLEGHVWPTLEIVLTESPRHLQRKSDAATGLALLDIGAQAA
jgi:predicted DNA-binding protein with PD1-like motif